jgi:hypothetical protein
LVGRRDSRNGSGEESSGGDLSMLETLPGTVKIFKDDG